MTPSTVSYYTDEVARGVEDYYAGVGEASGVWLGAGSGSAGLEGEVTAEQLARLFDARHPLSGEPLGAAYGVRAGADRVTGWDLTFSAPKSVSVLWAIGGGGVGLEVRDAHDAAVVAALGYVERHGVFSRRGKGGVAQVDTDGLVAAGFVHRSSRAGDPQLHTHVLVSGRVHCSEDGVWRALDSRALHAELKTAGMIYQAALRAELTRRLGVAWTSVDRHGQAEVAGVPDGVRRLFSSRRDAVERRGGERVAALEAELGRGLSAGERRRCFERAAVQTRTAKEHGPASDAGLHDRWLGEATAAGFAPGRWLGQVRDSPAQPGPAGEVVGVALEDMERDRAVWSRADVARAVTCHVPLGIGSAADALAWVEATVEQTLDAAGVVRLGGAEPVAPRALRRRDGLGVFERHGSARYTTAATLAVEQDVLDAVSAGRDTARGLADKAIVDGAVARYGLGEDQADAVRRLCRDGDAVAVVVGPAGTGKTRMVAAAHHAWTDAGHRVRGLAVSAVAAGVLHAETGIASDTLAKLLHDHARPDGPSPTHRLHHDEVIVVDEAGMLATRDLARLLSLAKEFETKVVLVGDPAQLGAVEAGGLFALLAAQGAVELAEVRRFTHEWECLASLSCATATLAWLACTPSMVS